MVNGACRELACQSTLIRCLGEEACENRLFAARWANFSSSMHLLPTKSDIDVITLPTNDYHDSYTYLQCRQGMALVCTQDLMREKRTLKEFLWLWPPTWRGGYASLIVPANLTHWFTEKSCSYLHCCNTSLGTGVLQQLKLLQGLGYLLRSQYT